MSLLIYTPVVIVVCCLELTALHCLVALCGCPCLALAVLGFGCFGAFFAFLRADGATGCDAMGGCEWTEFKAGWRFFLWVQWRIDKEIGFSGSVRHWNLIGGKLSQPPVIKTPRGSLLLQTARSSGDVAKHQD